ncbi:NUDIX hydrolase [Actinosynnema mirum DSM 43827]|uniref:NUDIX hydrolase n=2 Tax=Actinosynnema TaxID=40566 RepID=C6WF94_ACTMD|nr:NUDIX hydrolase [Actinosynnema mirum DSM 43827]
MTDRTTDPVTGHDADRAAGLAPGGAPERLVDDLGELPEWMRGLAAAAVDADADTFLNYPKPPAFTGRAASVLMLFGEGHRGPDLLLLRRADTLGSHPGQVAFPGGAADPEDSGPVGTALREAFEETGVLAEGVRPVALLPELHVPVSGFLVTPVLAHWRTPVPVAPVDPGETAAVARIPVAHLADPANRFRVSHPSGYTGPAFSAPGMLVWGFTAGLVSGLLRLGGWERPWDATDVRDLDSALRAT